jgi:hypothetical protein
MGVVIPSEHFLYICYAMTNYKFPVKDCEGNPIGVLLVNMEDRSPDRKVIYLKGVTMSNVGYTNGAVVFEIMFTGGESLSVIKNRIQNDFPELIF